MTMQGQGDGNGGPPPAGGSGAPPAGGTGQGSSQPPAGAATGSDDDDPDQPMTLREARALRREVAQAREDRRTREADEARRRQEGMTELERANARAATAEQERDRERETLRDERVSIRIEAMATRLGFIDPEAAVRLLDRKDIEFNGEGPAAQPRNLEALLKQLLRDKPYLKGTPGGSANAGDGNRGPAPTGGGMNDLIRRGAGRGRGVAATD